MKRIISVLLAASFLYSCNDKKSEKNESFSEVDITQTATEDVTTGNIGVLSYAIDGNNVEIMLDGNLVQTLTLDYAPKQQNITITDYDFDGFDDIFISSAENVLGISVNYYHYNSDNSSFDDWNELNQIGDKLVVDNKTLVQYINDACSLYCHYKVYEWDNENIVPTKWVSSRIDENDNKITDTFQYMNDGSKVLIERQISDTQGNVIKTQTADELVYFSMNRNGIDVLKNGELIQTIEEDYFDCYSEHLADCLNYTDEYQCIEEFLVEEDFDFDGYNDLFIPTMFGVPNVPGVYYRYNPNTSQFEEWDCLNKLGAKVSIGDDNTLVLDLHGSAVDYEITKYKWVDSNLEVISHLKQYADEYNEIYIDHFEFDENGNEYIVKREHVLIDENDKVYDTEEVPIQPVYSFTTKENSIDVMLNNEVVQTLDCTPVNENTIILDDYNFDGYDDLFVISDIQDEILSGTYYKLNSDTLIFEEWDELNKFGNSFNIGMSANSYIGKVLSYETDGQEKYIYKWENDTLILIEKIKIAIDKETNKAITELYYVDENGNETLIESAERVLNENPLDFD